MKLMSVKRSLLLIAALLLTQDLWAQAYRNTNATTAFLLQRQAQERAEKMRRAETLRVGDKVFLTSGNSTIYGLVISADRLTADIEFEFPSNGGLIKRVYRDIVFSKVTKLGRSVRCSDLFI